MRGSWQVRIIIDPHNGHSWDEILAQSERVRLTRARFAVPLSCASFARLSRAFRSFSSFIVTAANGPLNKALGFFWANLMMLDTSLSVRNTCPHGNAVIGLAVTCSPERSHRLVSLTTAVRLRWASISARILCAVLVCSSISFFRDRIFWLYCSRDRTTSPLNDPILTKSGKKGRTSSMRREQCLSMSETLRVAISTSCFSTSMTCLATNSHSFLLLSSSNPAFSASMAIS
mmetsp:Transcript_34573/g.64040  ORF Transcript_34573/g.64040 Transcript_34573/m.64040 type:complete len:231 (+) Transcript_34573:243-935(+)